LIIVVVWIRELFRVLVPELQAQRVTQEVAAAGHAERRPLQTEVTSRRLLVAGRRATQTHTRRFKSTVAIIITIAIAINIIAIIVGIVTGASAFPSVGVTSRASLRLRLCGVSRSPASGAAGVTMGMPPPSSSNYTIYL
jgi:hypothetical protein